MVRAYLHRQLQRHLPDGAERGVQPPLRQVLLGHHVSQSLGTFHDIITLTWESEVHMYTPVCYRDGLDTSASPTRTGNSVLRAKVIPTSAVCHIS